MTTRKSAIQILRGYEQSDKENNNHELLAGNVIHVHSQQNQ
jgi:hypothetical protein